MRTLRPPQLAHQVTHSTATLDNDSHHVHPSAGQQNIPELLNSPVTARPLQQPPKAPRRKPPPPYSAAPYPYCRSIPREGHRPTGSCARSPAGNQDHPRSPHGNAESNLLHLLANSNPIRSPDELLARLKSAATAAATAAASPIPACMQTQHDSDGLTGNRPTCDALTHRHNQLLLAPTELPQRLSTPAVSGSSPLLSRGRAPGPALQHNSPGWQQQTGSRVWEAPAVDHHSSHGLHLHRGGHGHGHGGIANAATQLQAGPTVHGSLICSASSLHVRTSPFAASSARDSLDSDYALSTHQGSPMSSSWMGQAPALGAQGSPVLSEEEQQGM